MIGICKLIKLFLGKHSFEFSRLATSSTCFFILSDKLQLAQTTKDINITLLNTINPFLMYIGRACLSILYQCLQFFVVQIMSEAHHQQVDGYYCQSIKKNISEQGGMQSKLVNTNQFQKTNGQINIESQLIPIQEQSQAQKFEQINPTIVTDKKKNFSQTNHSEMLKEESQASSKQVQNNANQCNCFQDNNNKSVYLNCKSRQKDDGKSLYFQSLSNLKQKLNQMTLGQLNKNQIVIFVMQIIKRNKTYACQFAHFLLPYCFLIVGQFSLNRDQRSFSMKILSALLPRLRRPSIRLQIYSQQRFEEYYDFLINYQRATYLDSIKWMRKFLTQEKKMTCSVCPYYYNFFALVVNKQIIFGGNPAQQLIKYSIQLQHRYYDKFTRQDVMMEIERMEKQLEKKYNSDRI